MADYTIRARFEVEATAAEVRRWLHSANGIAGWWSDKVEGAAASAGDVFDISFPSTPVVFSLQVTSISDDAVEWLVPESPPWWKGTRIRFELGPSESGGTSMLFTHAGFEPDDPIIEIITPAWIRYLDNLVAVAESGEANPAAINQASRSG